MRLSKDGLGEVVISQEYFFNVFKAVMWSVSGGHLKNREV